MLSGKKILSALLSAALLLPAASALAEDDAFAAEIERRYTAPSIDNRSEVRWWMAEAGHTDETIRAEIQAMYDGGFHQSRGEPKRGNPHAEESRQQGLPH